MKKLIALLAASMLLTSALASCGSDSDSSEEASTKASSSISDEESTEDATDGEEEDTTSTTKSKKTTKEATTAKVTTEPETEEATETPANASQIIGKWTFPAELMSEMNLDVSELPEGASFNEMYIEFTASGDMIIYVNMDMSSIIQLNDNGMTLSGMTFSKPAAGQTDGLIYDGSALKIVAGGQEVITFKRIGDPDPNSWYGKYTSEEMFSKGKLGSDKDYYIDFTTPGKTGITVSGKGEYSFDEKNSRVSVFGKPDSAGVEFKGDTMIWSTDKGDSITFNRIS